jgi:hypothetical protein
MDRTYIESQRIVQRYLSGDLTVREAREFERYCADHPDVLNSLPIPVRVKAKMARKPGEAADAASDTGSDFGDELGMPSNSALAAAGLDADEADDDDSDDEAPSRWQSSPEGARRWVMVLGFALLLALGGIVWLLMQSSAMEKDLKTQLRDAKALQLRPPGSVQTYRVTPSKTQPSSPTINVGNPESAVSIDLYVNLSDGQYNTFLVTIDDVERGRVAQVRRVARDSNRELRLSLNSSAFGKGDFDIKLEGYTWRGDTVPVGWIRLGLK